MNFHYPFQCKAISFSQAVSLNSEDFQLTSWLLPDAFWGPAKYLQHGKSHRVPGTTDLPQVPLNTLPGKHVCLQPCKNKAFLGK